LDRNRLLPGRARVGFLDEEEYMFTSINDRSVIVTGASKGIGKGIAEVFARAGAKVLVVARNGDAAEEVARGINNDGGIASAISADVTSEEDMKQMAAIAIERHGNLDILCANAGIYPQTKLEEMTVEEWDGVLATNLKGNFLSVKACLPHMKASDYGRIILTSSITGPVTGFPGWTHYGASKSAQLGFMRTACMEFAKFGITVNAVLPGNTLTESLMELGQDYLDTMAASVPLKRLGTVEDIGNAALFLATKEAGYITGQTITVDGGQIIPESLEALEEA
jgi:3-oxoacyl-[acyl-carrier protein] reductase